MLLEAFHHGSGTDRDVSIADFPAVDFNDQWLWKIDQRLMLPEAQVEGFGGVAIEPSSSTAYTVIALKFIR